jgi:hypothetical protein
LGLRAGVEAPNQCGDVCAKLRHPTTVSQTSTDGRTAHARRNRQARRSRSSQVGRGTCLKHVGKVMAEAVAAGLSSNGGRRHESPVARSACDAALRVHHDRPGP